MRHLASLTASFASVEYEGTLPRLFPCKTRQMLAILPACIVVFRPFSLSRRSETKPDRVRRYTPSGIVLPKFASCSQYCPPAAWYSAPSACHGVVKRSRIEYEGTLPRLFPCKTRQLLAILPACGDSLRGGCRTGRTGRTSQTEPCRQLL